MPRKNSRRRTPSAQRASTPAPGSVPSTRKKSNKLVDAESPGSIARALLACTVGWVLCQGHVLFAASVAAGDATSRVASMVPTADELAVLCAGVFLGTELCTLYRGVFGEHLQQHVQVIVQTAAYLSVVEWASSRAYEPMQPPQLFNTISSPGKVVTSFASTHALFLGVLVLQHVVAEHIGKHVHLPAAVFVALYVGLPWLYLLRAHPTFMSDDAMDFALAGTVLFQCINALICFWELSLFADRSLVHQRHKQLTKQHPEGNLPSPMCLTKVISAQNALSVSHWHVIWAEYAQIDPSYADKTTFGFWVDVGNGFTTLIPSMLVAIYTPGVESSLFSPAMLVAVSLCVHWQELYGTLVYFSSYFANARYRGKPAWHIYLVLGSNGLWVVGPILSVVVSLRLLQQH